MTRRAAVLAGSILIGLSGFTPVRAQSAAQQTTPRPEADPYSRVPAYHKEAPKGPLPATLDPKLFPDALNQNVYAVAAKEKKLLYQLPCYCGCDREAIHHQSLLDCYCDRHASICATCKMEAIFAYQESRKGKSAAQIRREIMAGKWRNVDLSSYERSEKPK
jgi:Protein of unknown function with PCYCGC motif